MSKSILKWAGGKSWLVPKLQSIFSNYKDYRLVEPFVGGLSVALGLNPKEALLNDINPHLINLYRQIQQGLKIDLLLENNKEVYYRYRELFNSNGVSDKTRAELFYFLNRTCFNGLCRFNSKGGFNVPFGKYKTINYRTDFLEYKYIFKDWEFSNVDFSLLSIKKRDFLYLDPPFDTEFTSYSKEDFKWADQIRLIDWLKDLNNPIVLSNQATDRIVSLYKEAGYRYILLEAPRRISCNGDRKPALEILAFKNINNGELLEA